MEKDSSIATLAADLREEVGRLRAGDRLPSSRALIERHQVGPVTVSRALALLSAEGLVVTRPGSGTFVAERRTAARPARAGDHDWQSVALGDRTVDAHGIGALLSPASEGVCALAGGYPAEALRPLRALVGAAARAARRPDAWDRPPPAGLGELRTWFARHVGGVTGGLTRDDVLIAGGGQQALSTVLRALLPHGAPLLVESPTYLGALAVARGAGVHPVPVPMDDEGVRPDLLADAFAMTGARVCYLQPTFHNPTGTVLSERRREQVLAVARAAGAFVVEDDFARLLGLAAPGTADAPPPPLVVQDDDGRVVHISSLTKATAPSLRIAGVIARGPVAERIRAVQLVGEFFPARPLQETALELVSSPGWPRHLRALRTALRSRQAVLATALAERLPELRVNRPAGGMHLWAELPAHHDDVAVAEAALRGGVHVSAGRQYFPAEPPGPYLRIGYGTAAAEAELVEGVRRLAAVLHRTATESGTDGPVRRSL